MLNAIEAKILAQPSHYIEEHNCILSSKLGAQNQISHINLVLTGRAWGFTAPWPWSSVALMPFPRTMSRRGLKSHWWHLISLEFLVRFDLGGDICHSTSDQSVFVFVYMCVAAKRCLLGCECKCTSLSVYFVKCPGKMCLRAIFLC